MYTKFIPLFLPLLLAFNMACQNQQPKPKDLNKAMIIPKPVDVDATGSSFVLSENTRIVIEDEKSELQRLASYFVETIAPATGFKLEIHPRKSIWYANIIFAINPDLPVTGEEGYRLSIEEKEVLLEAKHPAGIFRGIQTVIQLFPHEIASKTLQKTSWEIATGTIIDYPNYPYRSAMLDVSRHFFNVDEVKHFINWLAFYKMNHFHLHLSDDQGWRIEIKKWPKLTAIGGSKEVGGGKGGFYTQEEFTELVNYAKERYITIVPEIDMPGHTNAALASYAELNCDSTKRELYTGTKVGFSSLCVRKEITYTFITDVINEIAALTPGPYFHIGGDESHATKHEDYIYFINRVQKIVTAHGKKMIGWDEIVNADLDSSSVVQFWSNKENAQHAFNQGLKVIMSPGYHAYLDMKYDSTTVLGLTWAGYIEVDHAYNWKPSTYVKGAGKDQILGVECPLWTETVTNLDEMEYLVFPRLPGYAEIGWSQDSSRNWEEYKHRLGHQARRFELLGIDYYPSDLVPWK